MDFLAALETSAGRSGPPGTRVPSGDTGRPSIGNGGEGQRTETRAFAEDLGALAVAQGAARGVTVPSTASGLRPMGKQGGVSGPLTPGTGERASAAPEPGAPASAAIAASAEAATVRPAAEASAGLAPAARVAAAPALAAARIAGAESVGSAGGATGTAAPATTAPSTLAAAELRGAARPLPRAAPATAEAPDRLAPKVATAPAASAETIDGAATAARASAAGAPAMSAPSLEDRAESTAAAAVAKPTGTVPAHTGPSASALPAGSGAEVTGSTLSRLAASDTPPGPTATPKPGEAAPARPAPAPIVAPSPMAGHTDDPTPPVARDGAVPRSPGATGSQITEKLAERLADLGGHVVMRSRTDPSSAPVRAGSGDSPVATRATVEPAPPSPRGVTPTPQGGQGTTAAPATPDAAPAVVMHDRPQPAGRAGTATARSFGLVTPPATTPETPAQSGLTAHPAAPLAARPDRSETDSRGTASTATTLRQTPPAEGSTDGPRPTRPATEAVRPAPLADAGAQHRPAGLESPIPAASRPAPQGPQAAEPEPRIAPPSRHQRLPGGGVPETAQGPSVTTPAGQGAGGDRPPAPAPATPAAQPGETRMAPPATAGDGDATGLPRTTLEAGEGRTPLAPAGSGAPAASANPALAAASPAPAGAHAQSAEAARAVLPQITGAIRTASGGAGLELHLDPPELGRVRIDLDIADGGLRASLVAERAATGELLRNHGAILTQQLQDAGFTEIDLQFGAPDQDRGDGGGGPPGTPYAASEEIPDASAAGAATGPFHAGPEDGIDLRF